MIVNVEHFGEISNKEQEENIRKAHKENPEIFMTLKEYRKHKSGL